MLILKYVGVRRNPFLIVNGKQWDVYYSSQWFCLTGKCAAYVLEQLKNNKPLENYFKSTYVPDELVITIVGCTGCGDTKNAAQSDSALNADFAQTMAEADSLHNNMQFRDAYDLYLKLLDSKEARDNSVKRQNVFHEGNREP